MNKQVLLRILESNRTKHIKEYNEAREDYLVATINKLQEALTTHKAMKIDNLKPLKLFIDAPISHEQDYDVTIHMVQHHVDETIILTEQEYRAFVLDEWSWKKIWMVSNSSYKSMI